MPEISATEAARNFADLLDAVERGEEFTVIRRGRAVAHLEAASPRRGAGLKRALREHGPDRRWQDDLARSRELLVAEERT